MKRYLVFLIAAGLLCGEGLAASAADPSGGASRYAGLTGQARERFVAADADGDGALDREEFREAFPGLKREAFENIDADGDGRISPAEWASFAVKHGGHGAAREDSPSGMADPGNGAEARLPRIPIPRARDSAPEAAGEAPQPGARAPSLEALPLLSPPAR